MYFCFTNFVLNWIYKILFYSGDGTIRKTAEIWNKWNAANGNNLHGYDYYNFKIIFFLFRIHLNVSKN